MKFIDEYRDAKIAKEYAEAIAALAASRNAKITTRPWTIMEICGGQTHSIVKYGIDCLLPDTITLVHGPGCPVCVTSTELIDQAVAIASIPKIIFCSFGDMLRVPGGRNSQSSNYAQDLLAVKAAGGDIRTVYSPLDALKLAQKYPDKQVVFFAVGFETTVPTTAMAVYQAKQQNIDNFSLVVAHVLVPPAMTTLLAAPDCRIDGFLAAGHVCTVTGYQQYKSIAQKYRVPIVVTGFEPVDILQGVYMCISQLEASKYEVENQYTRSVKPEGNQTAQRLIEQVFEPTDYQWRGIGTIPDSGLKLRQEYRQFDAVARFKPQIHTSLEPNQCISGSILQGISKPHQCPAFGKKCTPEHPLGAPMVSSEGACAAYYRYRQRVVS